MRSASTKEAVMRANVIWALGLGVVIVSGIYAANLGATPASGFGGTTIAVGRFPDINVSNLSFFPSSVPENKRHAINPWISTQRTKGPSDLYVQNNLWAPGGSTGWHTHPGHSLIIVTAGTVTAYDGHDESCTPHAYTVGEGFVDAGGDHVHLIRNEGNVEAQTIAVQLIPAGATRRIDAAASPHCAF
jgi:hypothetical protein